MKKLKDEYEELNNLMKDNVRNTIHPFFKINNFIKRFAINCLLKRNIIINPPVYNELLNGNIVAEWKKEDHNIIIMFCLNEPTEMVANIIIDNIYLVNNTKIEEIKRNTINKLELQFIKLIM